ncbi:hypothetical protein EIP86_005235 [Pleurotus ostreatoroseus]|nr:hypothetical protein EIP86_005235 [Pleurotus ostreatoroseus]
MGELDDVILSKTSKTPHITINKARQSLRTMVGSLFLESGESNEAPAESSHTSTEDESSASHITQPLRDRCYISAETLAASLSGIRSAKVMDSESDRTPSSEDAMAQEQNQLRTGFSTPIFRSMSSTPTLAADILSSDFSDDLVTPSASDDTILSVPDVEDDSDDVFHPLNEESSQTNLARTSHVNHSVTGTFQSVAVDAYMHSSDAKKAKGAYVISETGAMQPFHGPRLSGATAPASSRRSMPRDSLSILPMKRKISIIREEETLPYTPTKITASIDHSSLARSRSSETRRGSSPSTPGLNKAATPTTSANSLLRILSTPPPFPLAVPLLNSNRTDSNSTMSPASNLLDVSVGNSAATIQSGTLPPFRLDPQCAQYSPSRTSKRARRSPPTPLRSGTPPVQPQSHAMLSELDDCPEPSPIQPSMRIIPCHKSVTATDDLELHDLDTLVLSPSSVNVASPLHGSSQLVAASFQRSITNDIRSKDPASDTDNCSSHLEATNLLATGNCPSKLISTDSSGVDLSLSGQLSEQPPLMDDSLITCAEAIGHDLVIAGDTRDESSISSIKERSPILSQQHQEHPHASVRLEAMYVDEPTTSASSEPMVSSLDCHLESSHGGTTGSSSGSGALTGRYPAMTPSGKRPTRMTQDNAPFVREIFRDHDISESKLDHKAQADRDANPKNTVQKRRQDAASVKMAKQQQGNANADKPKASRAFKAAKNLTVPPQATRAVKAKKPLKRVDRKANRETNRDSDVHGMAAHFRFVCHQSRKSVSGEQKADFASQKKLKAKRGRHAREGAGEQSSDEDGAEQVLRQAAQSRGVFVCNTWFPPSVLEVMVAATMPELDSRSGRLPVSIDDATLSSIRRLFAIECSSKMAPSVRIGYAPWQEVGAGYESERQIANGLRACEALVEARLLVQGLVKPPEETRKGTLPVSFKIDVSALCHCFQYELPAPPLILEDSRYPDSREAADRHRSSIPPSASASADRTVRLPDYGASVRSNNGTLNDWGSIATELADMMQESVDEPNGGGKLHPPRTQAYEAGHLAALKDIIWDPEGFKTMELSALPWMAFVGEPDRDGSGTETAGDVDAEGSAPYGYGWGCGKPSLVTLAEVFRQASSERITGLHRRYLVMETLQLVSKTLRAQEDWGGPMTAALLIVFGKKIEESNCAGILTQLPTVRSSVGS